MATLRVEEEVHGTQRRREKQVQILTFGDGKLKSETLPKELYSKVHVDHTIFAYDAEYSRRTIDEEIHTHGPAGPTGMRQGRIWGWPDEASPYSVVRDPLTYQYVESYDYDYPVLHNPLIEDIPVPGKFVTFAEMRENGTINPGSSESNFWAGTKAGTYTFFVETLYGGGKALVTGEAGRQLGERSVQLVENRTGEDFTGTAGEWLRFTQAAGGEVVGTTPLVEGISGYDIADYRQLDGWERTQRGAAGVSSLAGTAAGGITTATRVSLLTVSVP